MRYQSDVVSNREIVAKSLRAQLGDDLVKSMHDVVGGIYPLLETNVTRKGLIPYILEYKYEIAAWKALSTADAWLKLTVDMQQAKVTVRDITQIKQIIEQEFTLFLDEAREVVVSDTIELEPGQILVIKGAIHCNQTRGATGMTVTIQG